MQSNNDNEPKKGVTDTLRDKFKNRYGEYDRTEERDILGNNRPFIEGDNAERAKIAAERGKKFKSNEGIRPHRCDARFEEFLQGSVKTMSIRTSFKLFKTFLDCMKSEPENEPKEPYIYMDDEQVLFYEDMAARGRIRDTFFIKSESTDDIPQSYSVIDRRGEYMNKHLFEKDDESLDDKGL